MSHSKVALTDARLGKKPSAAMREAVNAPRLSGPHGELTIVDRFVDVDLAHVTMLAETGALEFERAGRLLKGLLRLRRDGATALSPDPALGSLLLQMESYLTDTVGQEAAGMLQLARSRVDQGATIMRLDVRTRLLDTLDLLVSLQQSLLERATEMRNTLMPGYTHIQHSQPWIMGHYLLGYFDAFQRDFERLSQTYARTNRSPLGTAAMAGTAWPVDRQMTATYLGFDSVIRNSKDANFVTGMDFLPETGSSLSLLMTGLGRIATEFYVWSSWEFAMIDLDEGLCGTSSLMPQKKNAHALERVRALSGESLGWMPAQLGLLRTPTSTDCDVNFSSREHLGYFDSARWALLLTGEVVKTFRVDREHLRRRAGANWSTASDLADAIVRKTGLSFREAHHIVGALVRRALDNSIPSDKTSVADLEAAAAAVGAPPTGLTEAEIRAALSPEGFVASRVSEGSIAPSEVERLLQVAGADHAANRERIAAMRKQIAEGLAVRDAALTKYVNPNEI